MHIFLPICFTKSRIFPTLTDHLFCVKIFWVAFVDFSRFSPTQSISRSYHRFPPPLCVAFRFPCWNRISFRRLLTFILGAGHIESVDLLRRDTSMQLLNSFTALKIARKSTDKISERQNNQKSENQESDLICSSYHSGFHYRIAAFGFPF